MKKTLLALLGALPLAACAGGYYGGPAGPGPIAYDGYYDDYYGQIDDGYWGDGDVFYYRPHGHGRYVPDRAHHFRRDMGGGQPMGGFHPMHGMMTPPAGHGGHHH